ncbi:hypothetical protein [Alienimonas californiensis]|uniref:Anaphase-promoting complex, cyclosome, subunit 3 n=1 Tax=Alienimonas californiensis TaxID=2527989 RepID=A0A517P736_9PLAN|nr:hypothetical protein [Alienimonas californiensis]QDT15191.1 hypothetical protein CA12_12720 [Alienimonas californiensis]
MFHRTASAAASGIAALGLLIVAAPAVGGELEDRYHAGLLERGLFGVAEGASLRTLRDPLSTPTAEQTAAVRLAAALAEHARYTDGPERDALLARAAEALADVRQRHPELPAVRTDLAHALLDAADALRRGRDALPELRPTREQTDAAGAALRAVDARLEALHTTLEDRRRDLTRGRSRDVEPLTAEELVDLTERAALALAELRLIRAELTPEQRPRQSLSESAEAFALPIRRVDSAAKRSVLLADSRRLSVDSRGAAEALAGVAGPRGDAAVAASLRLRLDTAGPGEAAARVATLRGDERTPTVLGPETEFVAAVALARLAAEARAAERGDLADRLLARLRRDADRAVAVHGGPWAARAARIADLAGRAAGLPPAVAAAVERADALEAAGAPDAPAARLAAARLALAAGVAPDVLLPLIERAATASRDDMVELLSEALTDAEPSAGAASAHLQLCSLLAERFERRPTPAAHRALADALNDHRARFAAFPTAAAATWRLARHEEVRDQRSQALPLYRELLDDPVRGPAAAAGLARCYEGILTWLSEQETEARATGEPTIALARRRQRTERRAAAVEELVPLVAASLDADAKADAPPLVAAARVELQLRTARVLLDGDEPTAALMPADADVADRLLTAVRAAAGPRTKDDPRAAFWRAAHREATARGAVTAARRGRFAEAARLAAAVPDDAAALLTISAGWEDAARSPSGGTAPPAFAAARSALAERLLSLSLSDDERRTVRVRGAAALLDRGEPTAAATELLAVLEAGHDPQIAELAAQAVAASRSPEVAAAALAAWRQAEAAETDGSAGWLTARARRIAGLHAAGRTDEAARLLAVTRLLHPGLPQADPAARRRFAALGRALGEPTGVARGLPPGDARRPAPPRW